MVYQQCSLGFKALRKERAVINACSLQQPFSCQPVEAFKELSVYGLTGLLPNRATRAKQACLHKSTSYGFRPVDISAM